MAHWLNAVALVLSASAAEASVCSAQIDQMQIKVDARLHADAATGPTARETAAATSHKQPTPQSLAAAETRLGDLPEDQSKAITQAMERARKADQIDDLAACQSALAQARRTLGD